jgi:hypothetical protein
MIRSRWLCAYFLGLFVVVLAIATAQALGPKPEAPSEPPTTLDRGAQGPRKPGGPIYPAQDIRVRFNHGQHLGEGMQCVQCHSRITASKVSSQNDLPTGEACDSCHGDQHPQTSLTAGDRHCADCHTSVDEQRVTATSSLAVPNLKFSHAAHLDRGTDCATCHGDFSKVGLATIRHLPTEATCLTCHDGKQASQRCSTCHASGSDGRLLTKIGDDPVADDLLPRGDSAWGAEHDLAFVQDHAGIAKANPELCSSCHDESSCQDCHAGPIRPLRLHAADYLNSHAVDARAATQDCSSCHSLQVECRGCHTRIGVSDSEEESAFGVGSPLRFHPDDWAGPPGALQGHAMAAQRNIATCASCHGEDTCLACHATTDAAMPGLDVSPHGGGFADSTRCSTLESHNRRVCLKCHAPGDPALDCR